MSDRKRRWNNLGSRLTFMIVFLAVTLCAALITTGYQIYKNTMEQHYIALGQGIVKTAASMIDGDAIQRYLDTGVRDRDYDETLKLLQSIQKENAIDYLYVQTHEPEGSYFIYDADEEVALGDMDEYSPDYPEFKEQVLAQGEVDPIISSGQYGYLLSIYEPVYGSDGQVKAYVGGDFQMKQVLNDRAWYLFYLSVVTAVITILFVLVYLYIIRKTIVSPIKIITLAANEFLLEGDAERTDELSSIAKLDIHNNDELQTLAAALKSMESHIIEYLHNLKKVTVQAETDALTKLWNRATFEQRVKRYLLENEDPPVSAFMMIDIDFFKHVNDTYGHKIGDEVLIRCAEALRRVFRGADMVARQGGDEFVAFGLSIGTAKVAEDKARQIGEEWLKIVPEGAESGITASIGIALSPRDGVSFQELFEKADAALYEVKEQGRNGFKLYG